MKTSLPLSNNKPGRKDAFEIASICWFSKNTTSLESYINNYIDKSQPNCPIFSFAPYFLCFNENNGGFITLMSGFITLMSNDYFPSSF